VKIICSGELTKKVNIKGLRVTKGAKEAIIKLGGTIEE
jgi:ribosomal protein L15